MLLYQALEALIPAMEACFCPFVPSLFEEVVLIILPAQVGEHGM